MPPMRIRTCRTQGFALVLVLVAVSVAVILSCTYLALQSISAQLSVNLEDRVRARMIAESGLEMAIADVRADDNWRAKKTHGLWVDKQPFDGGTITIWGEDGQDADGDGNVDGDGDLANCTMDMLTLTAVGRYGGAAHRVRAVVPPVKRVLIIVPDPANLKTEDVIRRDLLRCWGWRVYLLRAAAAAAEFDAAAVKMNVIYFPAHAALETAVRDKLRISDVPIVAEHKQLVKELKITDSDSREYLGASIDVLQLTRTVTDDYGAETTEVYVHYITAPFPIGRLWICGELDDLLCLDGSMIGTEALAAKTFDPTRVTLGVLESGALRADRKPARARRVALPWGKGYYWFSIDSLNANGREILRRSLDWAGSSWIGYLPGIAVWDEVELKDTAEIDAYNAGLGAYGGGNATADAAVCTNSISADKIDISSGVLRGSIFVSPNADPSKVVRIGSGATVTGAVHRLRLNVPIPTPHEPADLGSAGGDLIFLAGENIIDSDRHVKRLEIHGDAVVRIAGNVRILCDEEVRIEDNAQLRLDAGAQLTMFTKRKVVITGGAKVNPEVPAAVEGDPPLWPDPSRLAWIILEDRIEASGGAQVHAMVRTYDGQLHVKETARIFGTFVGKRVLVENSAAFHVDTSSSGTVTTMGTGIDLGTISGGVRWVERP